MAQTKRTSRKSRAKKELTVLSLVMILLLAAVVGVDLHLDRTGAGAQTVTIGVIGSSDDQIWKAVQQELDRRNEHIRIRLKPFQDAIYVNQATANREVDLNAAQHYVYLEDDARTNHYKLSVIGDTYISPMNLYSRRYSKPSQFQDGDKVAIPNNATNMGRALKVLADAKLIGLRDPKATNPLPEDVVENPKHLQLEQVDPAGILNLLPDYAGGVTNANFVVDAGMSVHDAIHEVPYDLQNPANKPYINIIVTTSDQQDNPIYAKVVRAYHSKPVADTITRVYKGACVPAFKV